MRVTVWYADPADFESPEVVERLLAVLSEEERARRDRFFFDRDRHLFLVAHWLVRTTLSRYRAVAPAAWTFVTNAHGRPEIDTPSVGTGLRFNLSHTPGMVVCAVVETVDVGVDVEDSTRLGDNAIGLADRFFSPLEVNALHALPAAQRHDRFFRLWTLKESYIKARGMGLSLPLDQFSFHLDEGPPRISFGPKITDVPRDWQFAEHRLTRAHRLALAVRSGAGERLELRVRSVGPENGPTPALLTPHGNS